MAPMTPGGCLRLAVVVLVALCSSVWGAVTGSITGTLKDPDGLVIVGAMVTVTNEAQGIQNKTVTDEYGVYTFPSLPVGRYDLLFEAEGFKPQNRTGLAIDIDSALTEDATLEVAQKVEQITVAENVVQVETTSTQVGQVVSGTQMTSVALNGRSFTDLLALQPGIVPTTTQLPDSIVMAGVTVAIAPSGVLNAGNQSISGQREDANGFMVNGGDVKELMNGGTSIVPNLDSIAEFRILTNNFDAEYGNYSGGIINVVTKSGSNQLHGSVFEFLRNTDLDARNFFSPERSFYRQNQFGGTAGRSDEEEQGVLLWRLSGDPAEPRHRHRLDFRAFGFRPYGESRGSSVLAHRIGQQSLPRQSAWSKTRVQVTSSEPYYTPGCITNVQCVFPNAIIPQRAWSAPAQHLLQYIPVPNIGPATFSTASEGQILRDDKGGLRVDGNSDRWGLLSAYYFVDDYDLNNPYPRSQGGASVPGFAALNLGRSQLINLSDTKTFGATTVNELRLSLMRSSNNVGQPSGGVGPSLASQGFVTGVGTSGIVPLAPSIEGIENVVFNAFTMGTPITNLKQANNTLSLMDNVSKVLGPHTLKAGAYFSYEQVNVNPDATFNGSFLFTGNGDRLRILPTF